MFGTFHVVPIAVLPEDFGRLQAAALSLEVDRAHGFLEPGAKTVHVSAVNPRVLIGGDGGSAFGWLADVPNQRAASGLRFRVRWEATGLAARGREARAACVCDYALTLSAATRAAPRFWGMTTCAVDAAQEAAPYPGPVARLILGRRARRDMRCAGLQRHELLVPCGRPGGARKPGARAAPPGGA